MVGGLVQQHNIRSPQQKLDKGHLGLLTAGKAADGTFQILQPKPEPLEHDLHVLPPGITPQRLHLSLQAVIFPQNLSAVRALHLLLQLIHALLTGKNRSKDLFDLILHSHLSVRKIHLAQKTDLLFSRCGNAALLIAVQVIHLNISCDQLEKRGLSAAVSAHNSYFFIVMYLKIHILQYGVRTKLHQCMPDLISHIFTPIR